MTKRAALVLLAVLAAVFAAFALSPERRLRAAQREFMEALSRKDEKDCVALLHEDYTDAWGFRKEDWPLLLNDLRALAPDLGISTPEPEVVDADTGLIEARLQASALASPASHMIMAEIQRHRTPARFLWKRASWLPWSWRLVEIQHPDVKVPANYTPGSYSARAADF